MAKPDLSEFEALSKPRYHKICGVSQALEQLSGDDRDALEAALTAEPGHITNAAIEKWLATRGVDCKWQAVRTHREGACSCG